MASPSASYSSALKIAFIIGIAADCLLAYILARLLLDKEPTLDVFGVYLLLVIGAQWIVGIWRWLKRNGALWFAGKDQMRRLLLTELRRAELPPPGQEYSARFDYLERLADDPRYDPDDRVKAATLYTALQSSMTHGGIVTAAIMSEAFDSAVKDYNAETPDKFSP